MRHLIPLFLLALGLSSAGAQTLRLREAATGATRLELVVGQAVDIEVVVDVQDVAAGGLAFFLTVEGEGFAIADQDGDARLGTQPFRPGPVLATQPLTNLLLPETDDVARVIPGLQLDYAAFEEGITIDTAASGVVATFTLVAVAPTPSGRVVVDDNPVRETRLIGADGISERRFVTVQGMEVTVAEPGTAVAPAVWGTVKSAGR